VLRKKSPQRYDFLRNNEEGKEKKMSPQRPFVRYFLLFAFLCTLFIVTLHRKVTKRCFPMTHLHALLPFMLFCLLPLGLSAQEKSEPLDTTLLREASINGQSSRISYRPGRQKIDASQVLTASGGTALDVLRAVPGVVVDADGSLSYRSSQEFLVYVDGKLSPLTGTEALQMIGAASIKDIEILTTPSAKYRTEGDVGIINIVTRRSETDGWDVVVNGTASTWRTLSLDTKINFRTGHHNIYIGGQGSDVRNKSRFEQEKQTAAGDASATSGRSSAVEAMSSTTAGTALASTFRAAAPSILAAATCSTRPRQNSTRAICPTPT